MIAALVAMIQREIDWALNDGLGQSGEDKHYETGYVEGLKKAQLVIQKGIYNKW